MITLYDYTAAPSPRRARIFLAEKAVDYKCVQIDIRAGEQLGEDFKAINPRCAVPTLVTEKGDAISENLAIASYIEELFPEPNLMGRTPLERAQVLEWNWRCEFEGLSAIAEILRNTSPAMKNRAMTGPRNVEQLPVLAERGALRLGHFFEDLNAQLAKTDYICGQNFTFADITAIVGMDFAKWVKQYPSEDLTALHAWHKKISERPSYKA